MRVFLVIILFIIPIFFLILKRRNGSPRKQLPPGSLGLPIIGQSLTLLRVMKANTSDEWLADRVRKYGPVSKMSLFGKPNVFIKGQAANKLVFSSESGTLSSEQTTSLRVILEDRSLIELSGDDHKRVRDALVSFLRPECLKQYVGKIEGEVRKHIEVHWQGKDQVTVLPLMKKLTFNIICSILFGIESGSRRDKFISCFEAIISGLWSIPINLPFTCYRKSLQATAYVRELVRELIHEKLAKLEQKKVLPHEDLITCLLSIRDKDGKQVLSEDEIVHNVIFLMVAGHDTSSVLLTFMICFLANDPTILSGVVAEHEHIAESKSEGDLLTWEDLVKMKYTWSVAMETMRLVPPVFGGFRTTLKDIEFGGYIIPRGWQVSTLMTDLSNDPKRKNIAKAYLSDFTEVLVRMHKIFWVTSMTHMDANTFQEPLRFDQTRFENKSAIPRYCYVPFGGGVRICPGYEFAKIETLVAMHFLVTRFTWKLICKDGKFSRDPTPIPTGGLPIQIIPKRMM